MFSQLWVLSLVPLILPAFASSSQHVLKEKGDTNPLNHKFAQLANESLALWKVPGISVAVVDGDNVFAEGYGFATIDKIPATASTLYCAGSTTKAFVAAAMSLLIDPLTDSSNYSDLTWDTPISQLIREDFVLETEYATMHTTIEDALSHRSGMPRHDGSYSVTYEGRKATPRDVVRSLRYLPMTAEPRTKWQYCNMMYVVVSHVLQILTGMWLGEFLRDNIWSPLGMNSTYFSNLEAEKSPEDLAQGYIYHNSKYQEVPYMSLAAVSGAGSVISNVLDYTKWIKALLKHSGPISEAGYRSLLRPRQVIDRDWTEAEEPSPFVGTQAYSLGWANGVYRGYEWFQHSGGMEAFGAQIIFFPSLDYGLVTFGNTAITSNTVGVTLIWKLVDDKLEVPEGDRFNWTAKYEKEFRTAKEKLDNAKKEYYPNVPSPPLSPSLPLQNYTGTYYHPAYHNMTIYFEDGTLHADRDAAVWKVHLDFEHVSSDYFMVDIDSITAPGSWFKDATAAEFVIGSDGKPKTFKLAAEPEMGLDGRISFERI